ncbi:MAG TPA: NAD-dependent succinate-semialdehyde dehydrogenase [Ignavibacteriaceae bacterium]|nr:NAD-dependent succinate-semialdehyde dehydrogenase [Ignavibacteriaceae bacterium]
MLSSINPASNEVLQQFEEMSSDEINKIIDSADKQFNRWKWSSFKERAPLMKNAAEVIRKKKDDLAALITLEMGKPILQSKGEVEKCAWVCDYYSENAEEFLKDEIIKTDASKSFVTFNPFGVVLSIMPWNFPFWQVFRFAAPTLMAGNAGLLKHSSNVTGCALAIENIFKEAGFPQDLFRTLVIGSSKVEQVIKNDKVMAVSLTGSVGAGKKVAAAAGSVLKKCVLELGGSDPYIILEDADLDKAAEICVNSRLINNGQSCIAAKRFIAVERIYDEFERLFVDKMHIKKMGDPFNEEINLGPQARTDLRDELHEQVEKSISAGAKPLLGCRTPELIGAFYPASVLADVKPGMPAYEEELFGPVASLIKAKDEDDAIRIANDSIFGLGSAIFTKEVERGERLAKEKINSGCCFVNDSVKSDPRLPFGGIKESGYGRELSSYGIKEFVNIKTVYVK